MILFSLEQHKEELEGCICLARRGYGLVDTVYPQACLITRGRHWSENSSIEDDQTVAPSNLVGW